MHWLTINPGGILALFGGCNNLSRRCFTGHLIAGFVLGLLATFVIFSRAEAVPEKNVSPEGSLDMAQTGADGRGFELLPVYRIKLRVHLGGSSRAPEEFVPIFAEINEIWLGQAGICFEIHTVDHDTTLSDGLDMWFAPDIGGYNGYYDGEHIQMSDAPVLKQTDNPAGSAAARTAAHELGHALDLRHRQDSDDNLMRSRTYGWYLNTKEILHARQKAAEIAIADTRPLSCGPAQIGS